MQVPISIRSGLFACALVAASASLVHAADDPLRSLSYREIGPAISGGRTTAVAGSDRDPMVYYAGGAGGGVFKSVDGGTSWRPVFDGEAVAPIGAIAVSPRDPGDVWVGTGEANPRNDAEEGRGLWHSRDGGKHWQHVGLDDAGSISAITIDPRDPRIVAVGVLGHIFRDGTTRGVFVTRDGGTHWTRTLYLGPSSGISDLQRVPDRPSTVFAGVWQFRREPWKLTSGGPAGGLFRSDDNGAHWRKLTGNGLPDGLTGRIGIAAGTRGRIYAIVQSKAGDIWRSDDGGVRWKLMPHSPFIGARPFYFSHLFVDPSNPNRVLNVSLILGLSTDGARTFHATATEAGWDYHATWWSHDGRRVINGNDEGVVISADGGHRWHQPYDLPFAQPYHVGYDDVLPSYHVCIGLQDNNSWCAPSSSDNGVGVLNRDWFVAGPGDGMWARYDPSDHDLIWTTSTNTDPGNVYLYDARTKQAKEVSPDPRSAQAVPATLAHRFNWDTPLAFSGNTVLVGGNVIFATTDRGVHWTTISPDLTRNDPSHQQVSGGPISQDASGAEMSDTILQIAPQKLAAGKIWVGTDDGLVQLTRDNGATWTNVTPPGAPHWGRVYTIEPGHASATTAYIAVDDHMNGDDRPHLFATDDDGANWRAIAGDLPSDAFTRSVREDPGNPSLLYAGTRKGVFVSFDGGTHWRSLRLNMPATAIYDLQIQPGADDLIVAAHGRGVWILDDLHALQAWSKSAPVATTLFAPRDTYRVFRSAPVNTFTDGKMPDGEFVGGERPSGALITYALMHPARRLTIEIVDPSGHVVRSLSGKDVPKRAGINRAHWDLTETGPVRWKLTFEQNRGPETGAEARSGTYTVRLIADGDTRTQPLTVKADPREAACDDDAERRHAFLAQLNADISIVDTMLNDLDARIVHAVATRGNAQPLVAFKQRLTVDAQNIEDLKTPAQVRERLLDLLGRVAPTSFQAPTASQDAEAATLHALASSLQDEYRQLK